jgi:uncharacterized protein
MIYTFILIDKPGAAELRQRVRPEHKAYLALVAERMAFAGPLTSDDGQTMIGSLLAIDFAFREAARAWLSEEPFRARGAVRQQRAACLRQPVAAKGGFSVVAQGSAQAVRQTYHDGARRQRPAD